MSLRVKIKPPEPDHPATESAGGTTTELSDAVRRWLDLRLLRGEITKKTAKLLSPRFVVLVELHGNLSLSSLDADEIDRWLGRIRHHSPATRRAYLSTVRCFCRWLVSEGTLETDPTAHVGRIREPRRVPRAQSKENVARCLEVAHTSRDRLVLWLMVGMGLRCVEVSRADVADFDPANRTLLVRGKAGHERVLPVPGGVAELIVCYLDDVGWQAGPLIRTLVGRHRRVSEHTLSRRVADIMREAKVKRRPHDGASAHALRHTAASDVLDRCHDVRVVQQMLGHQSLATTQIYLRRASLDQLREAMEGRTYQRAPTIRATALRGAPGTGEDTPATGSATEGSQNLTL